MRSIVQRILACVLLLGLAAAAHADADPREYVLGPGDIIKIGVFQNPDLAVETRVTETGAITFPLVGSVSVGGLSVPAAERHIGDRLREGGFVLQPQVNILVLQIRGSQVSVLGQVNRPGRYPLETAATRLSDVLALAGGITSAGADTVTLVGLREGRQVRREIDVPAMFSGGKAEQDVAVLAGDIIYVDRAPFYYIYGEVQRPGVFRLERDMSVMQALAQGGGITVRGTQRGIRVHRRDAGGSVQRIEPEMEDKVVAGDVIYVKESLF